MNPAAGSRGNLLCSCSRPPEIIVASLIRQIYYYRLGSIAARLGCYAVRAGLKLRAAVALPPIFTDDRRKSRSSVCLVLLTLLSIPFRYAGLFWFVSRLFDNV